MFALKQLMPLRMLLVVAGLGAAAWIQPEPNQVSTRLTSLPPRASVPAAAQNVSPAHDTVVKVPDVEEPIGTVSGNQRLPFQCSASGGELPAKFDDPTSMQLVGAPHETLNAPADTAPVGSGRLVITQDEPFHCSAIGPLVCDPTAMHHETERHETPVST